MSPSPALLGIRHHGPGSARSVVAALDELHPDVVLVELPADTAGVLAWIADPGLRPPVALLGHVVDDPRRAVFSPLAEFSPEWQAIGWALRHGVAVEPIDLPLTHRLAQADDGPVGPAVDPIAELAAAAGASDAERWWDDVVEHRGDGTPAFDAIATAMAAVREGTPTSTLDGWREAHMRRSIRRASRAHGPVAVVCGAWHVPALDPDATTEAHDRELLRGLPKVKVAHSWVPWSHPRLARSTGYGAGVDSPGWYAHVFRHAGTQTAVRFLVEAAREVRADGLSASPEHVIAAIRLADALASLRGRPRPGLEEILDATDAVIGGLPLVRRRLVVGDAVGAVPAGAPQAPLARDVATLQRRARLTPTAEPRTVELDVRTTGGRGRSVLLHRCAALGLGWASVVEGRGSTGTFRETWHLAWHPELAVRLVELAPYGTTLERAATARLVERCDGADLVTQAASLDLALAADLPDASGPIIDRLAVRSALDPDVTHLMDALGPLARALRYGDARGSDLDGLAAVVDGLVTRVVAGVEQATAGLDEDAADAMAERLMAVHGALALLDHPTRHGEWPAVLAGLAAGRPAVHGVVQGRATRLLHDGGHWDPPRVGRRFARALSVGPPPTEAAAFLDGFLAGSGTVLVHDGDLLAIVDGWLSTLSADAFDRCLPVLRRTFGGFEPAERHRLGRLLTGAVPDTGAGELDDARVAAALDTVRALLGLAATSA